MSGFALGVLAVAALLQGAALVALAMAFMRLRRTLGRVSAEVAPAAQATLRELTVAARNAEVAAAAARGAAEQLRSGASTARATMIDIAGDLETAVSGLSAAAWAAATLGESLERGLEAFVASPARRGRPFWLSQALGQGLQAYRTARLPR
jgi:hypothetical protein